MDDAIERRIRQGLTQEALRYVEDLKYSYKGLYNVEAGWRRTHLGLGIPAAALAAGASATTALALEPWVAIVLGMGSAVLAATMTVVNPEARAQTGRTAALAAQAHMDRLRRWVYLDLPLLDTSAARKQLEDLAAAKHKILREAPPIHDVAFRRARKGIEEGEAHHEVDGAASPQAQP